MIKNIFSALKDYRGTLKLIGELRLWRYYFIPALISLLLAIAIGSTAWGLSDNIGDWIEKIWIWEWGKETFGVISEVIGGLAILAIGLLIYKHLVLALSAPFMGPVSEKIEAHQTGKPSDKHSAGFFTLMFRGLRIGLRNFLMELLFTLVILIFSFVPVIAVVTTPLLFLVQAYYAGFGNMDYTLERHFGFTESIRKVRNHSGIAIGNGIPFMLLLLIPILGVLIVLPLSVTAATISSTKLIHKENNLKIST